MPGISCVNAKGAFYLFPNIARTGLKSTDFCARLLEEEYAKLRRASNRDVHDDSKDTTLPIARTIVAAYVQHPVKAPWYVDLLNLNLGLDDLPEAERRIAAYFARFAEEGVRITENLDF